MFAADFACPLKPQTAFSSRKPKWEVVGLKKYHGTTTLEFGLNACCATFKVKGKPYAHFFKSKLGPSTLGSICFGVSFRK